MELKPNATVKIEPEIALRTRTHRVNHQSSLRHYPTPCNITSKTNQAMLNHATTWEIRANAAHHKEIHPSVDLVP
jgi:hypothetical protein